MTTYPGPVEESPMSKLWIIGFIIIVVGFILVFAGTLLSMQSTNASGNTSIGVGGCVIIFFIPICFGQGAGNLWIIGLIIGIVLTIFSIILFLLSKRVFM